MSSDSNIPELENNQDNENPVPPPRTKQINGMSHQSESRLKQPKKPETQDTISNNAHLKFPMKEKKVCLTMASKSHHY